MNPYLPTAAPIEPATYRNDPEYVAYLEQRIAALESRIPNSRLISPKFWTRAWAVYGHMLAAGLAIWATVMAVYVVLAMIIGVVAFMAAMASR